MDTAPKRKKLLVTLRTANARRLLRLTRLLAGLTPNECVPHDASVQDIDLDLLSPLEKRIIQVASVAGRIFWVGAILATSELSAVEAVAALDRLQERELVEERAMSSLAGEREFMFKHALTAYFLSRMGMTRASTCADSLAWETTILAAFSGP